MVTDMVYLALRKTNPPGVGPLLFAKMTTYRLVTRYPHAGIVVDGTLYQATLKDGVHSTPFDPLGWDLFSVDLAPALALDRFTSVKGARYDWFSLLGFILPFRVSKGSWFYCYELAYFIITGIIPTGRITPEDLLRIAHATSKTATERSLGMVH